MKKRTLVLTSIILVILTLASLGLGACSSMKFTLSAPVLAYENGVVSWSARSFAEGYNVTLYRDTDGERGEAISEPVTVTTTNYALTQDGKYWVGVYVISSNSLFSDSPESYILVEKEDTQVDVTVPEGGDPSEGEDPDDPYDPPYDVLPSGVPALDLPVGAKQSFNYMSIASVGGISIALTKNTDEVVRLFKNNSEVTSGWSYDAANNAVELGITLFAKVSEGTDTAFTAVTASGKSFDFYVTLCGLTDVPVGVDLPSYGAYVYNKNSDSAADGLKISYNGSASTLAVSVDGLKISNSTANYAVVAGAVNFKEDYLKTLEYGLHKVELFTTKGVIDFYIFVYSSSIMCYDLTYEFDDSYPSLLLRWSVDYPIDKYEVIVDGVTYSSDEYPEKFDGKSFDLTGIVAAGSNCSVCIKSYVDGLSTPATSATAVYADNTSSLAAYLDPDKGFTYLSRTFNRYIDCDEEMDVLAYYMILYNDDLDTATFNTASGNKTMTYMDVYLAPTMGISGSSSVMNAFAESCAKYKESIKYSYAAYKLGDGAYRIGLSMTSQNEALYDSTSSYTESASNEFHLYRSTRSSTFDDFAINDREGASVSTSDQLFFAVEAGFRPVPVEGSVAERLYELAKDVCRTYIDDSMTDYEKVHTIYDWLGKYVVYDYNLVSQMTGIDPSDSRYDPFYSYDSFYLEGVLENHVAVCNGIAKTFVLLCSIEGITAVKVNGVASGGAHAWNKVLINGKWYIVDSTWSNQKSTNYKEVFTHDYLLITTSASSKDRTETTDDTLRYYCGDTHYVVTAA